MNHTSNINLARSSSIQPPSTTAATVAADLSIITRKDHYRRHDHHHRNTGCGINNNNNNMNSGANNNNSSSSNSSSNSATCNNVTSCSSGTGGNGSTRGLLASLWSLVVVLTFLAFSVAAVVSYRYTVDANNADGNDQYSNYYNGDGQQQDNDEDEDDVGQLAVTGRALAFCTIWTLVVSVLMAIVGSVILGIQSPFAGGVYYTCCAPQVHRTTPLALGSFTGALLMFSNLTFICAVLFGEFDIIEEYRNEAAAENKGDDEDQQQEYIRRTSSSSNDIFSILCIFLTVLYVGFASVLIHRSKRFLYELEDDYYAYTESKASNTVGPGGLSTPIMSSQQHHGGTSYFGERFDSTGGAISRFATPDRTNQIM